MIVALVFFSIDTLLLFGWMVWNVFEGSYLIDILFHAWVLYYLIVGTMSGAKIFKNSAPNPEIPAVAESTTAQAE
jgi:hypothetical protein